jgi:hypothetical protein
MTFTDQVIANFRKKYPFAYQLYIDGDKGILRWLIDNMDSFKPDRPKFVVIAKSKLQSVYPDGTHHYN